MRLTSMEINNKDFKRGFRGYDIDEVDEFLEKISEDYEAIYKENSTLKEKLTAMTEKLNHYAKIEDTIQNTLLLAQNAAEQAKVSAQKEADLIVKNANEASMRIMDKARNDVLQVNDQYESIKQEFNKFRAKYRSFMKSQLEMFESTESDIIKSYNVGKVQKEDIKEKDIDITDKFNVKDVDENEIKDDDLSEIKSFFIKDE